ncbi:hypothetical protein K435DRAFT_607391, partial [Dendrothele bispora CBS 962.96]
DRLPPFTPGPSYGPVLTPLELSVLGVLPILNPLLCPPTDTGTEPFLKWNLLFSSAMCQRSDDPPHVSWARGRNDPATFPRVTQLTLIPCAKSSSNLPFIITVYASIPDEGVSCGDVIEHISSVLYARTGGGVFECLGPQRKDLVAKAYRANRSRTPGVPGGALGEGMRRLDLLGPESCWGGMGEVDGMREIGAGVGMPWCTYEWFNVTTYPMTPEEARVHEERQRAVQEEHERIDRER